MIGYEEAQGRLKTVYDRIAGPSGQVDRVLQLHGLRPHTLEAHLALYKATLHHTGNRLPRWFLELIGVAVSGWNGCAYCVAHHRAGLQGLVGKELGSALVEAADLPAPVVEIVVREAGAKLTDDPALAGALQAALGYARALTLTPGEMQPDSVTAMREAGMDDGMILEVNQVTGYFNYVNRAILGLGVSHVGERLGLAPSNTADEADMSHR